MRDSLGLSPSLIYFTKKLTPLPQHLAVEIHVLSQVEALDGEIHAISQRLQMLLFDNAHSNFELIITNRAVSYRSYLQQPLNLRRGQCLFLNQLQSQ